MSDERLILAWMGTPPEEIMAIWPHLQSVEQWEKDLADLHDALAEDVLGKILGRAREGDVAAVVWLEEHGLLTMPRSAARSGAVSES